MGFPGPIVLFREGPVRRRERTVLPRDVAVHHWDCTRSAWAGAAAHPTSHQARHEARHNHSPSGTRPSRAIGSDSVSVSLGRAPVSWQTCFYARFRGEAIRMKSINFTRLSILIPCTPLPVQKSSKTNWSVSFTISRGLLGKVCLILYRISLNSVEPLGDLTFERQVMDDFPEWSELPNLFNELHVFSTGTIEDDGKNMLQVDFANRYIGGGVLGNVCVHLRFSFDINCRGVCRKKSDSWWVLN